MHGISSKDYLAKREKQEKEIVEFLWEHPDITEHKTKEEAETRLADWMTLWILDLSYEREAIVRADKKLKTHIEELYANKKQ